MYFSGPRFFTHGCKEHVLLWLQSPHCPDTTLQSCKLETQKAQCCCHCKPLSWEQRWTTVSSKAITPLRSMLSSPNLICGLRRLLAYSTVKHSTTQPSTVCGGPQSLRQIDCRHTVQAIATAPVWQVHRLAGMQL